MSFDQLLLTGESQTLEFKANFDKTTVESLVAFANAQGGTILVGVSDAGLIHGVSLGKETLNEWGMQNSHSDSFASSPACGRGLRRGKRAWQVSLPCPLGQIKSAELVVQSLPIRFVAKDEPGNGWLATLTHERANKPTVALQLCWSLAPALTPGLPGEKMFI